MFAGVKRILIAVFLGAVYTWGVGCTTTKPGRVVDENRAGPKQEIGASYSINVTESASSKQGPVTLTVRRVPKYRVPYVRKRVELEKRSSTFGWTMTTLGLVGLGLGAGIAPECFGEDQPGQQCETPAEETKAQRASTVLLGALGAIIIGSYGVEWANRDTSYSATDERIVDGTYTRTEEGRASPLPEEPVTLTLNGTTRRYTTDEQGQISVDVADAFGLHSLDNPRPQIASAVLPSRDYTQSLTLNPQDWMVPYFRLTEAQYRLRERPSREASVLGTTRRDDTGEEFRVHARRSDWIQLEYRGETRWIHREAGTMFWAVPTRLDSDRLPRVTASATFTEPSGNNRLDADETAQVRVTVRNEGEGPAYRVRAYVEPETHPHLSYPHAVDFGRIDAGASTTQTLRIEADREVPSSEVGLTFRFREANGFAPSPLKIQFETRRFVPPELNVADVGIDDANGNGIIDRGEVVTLTARIRNASRGRAQDVSAHVHFGEDVFPTANTRQSFELGTLGPGEHRDIRFSFYTNQRATSVPVTVDLTEKYGEFGKSGIELPLEFNRPTDKVTVVDVPGQDETVTVEEGLSVDIETNIPSTPMDRPNAIAVVIGIRSYAAEGIPDVKYARRDARYMREYLTQTLGFRKENILPRNPDGRMTFAEMRTLIQEKLPSYVKEGTSEVFVYYSGHGAPSTGEEKRAYLVPSDTDPNFVSDANAYRLSQFYEDLAALEAKSVTVALDACFTGQAGSGKMMLRQASPLALSVENPLLGIENATGFLASGPKQVANWYPSKKHGMFTYFFLKGLKGKADLNSNRKVTVREMKRYLTDEDSGVPYWSGRVHQRKQVPQVVSRTPDQVLVRLKDR